MLRLDFSMTNEFFERNLRRMLAFFHCFFPDDSRITVLYPAIGFVTAVVSYGYWHYGIEELLR